VKKLGKPGGLNGCGWEKPAPPGAEYSFFMFIVAYRSLAKGGVAPGVSGGLWACH